MELIDKLKDEFPALNEDILLEFIEEAKEEVREREQRGKYKNDGGRSRT